MRLEGKQKIAIVLAGLLVSSPGRSWMRPTPYPRWWRIIMLRRPISSCQFGARLPQLCPPSLRQPARLNFAALFLSRAMAADSHDCVEFIFHPRASRLRFSTVLGLKIGALSWTRRTAVGEAEFALPSGNIWRGLKRCSNDGHDSGAFQLLSGISRLPSEISHLKLPLTKKAKENLLCLRFVLNQGVPFTTSPEKPGSSTLRRRFRRPTIRDHRFRG